jgi:large subunit ribosomal protein L17
MRHGKKFNHLKRKSAHRKALLRNLSIALITHKRITTTLAKAKALRVHFEPLVTKAKSNTTHSRRVVFSYLQNKEAIKELFGTIADKVGDRPGGYVRIIKLGFRRGDGAEMAMIELVDFNDVYAPNEDSGRSEGGRKRRRRRGGGGGQSKASTTTTTAEETEEEDIQEDVIEDAPVDTVDEETTEDTEAEEKDEEEK